MNNNYQSTVRLSVCTDNKQPGTVIPKSISSPSTKVETLSKIMVFHLVAFLVWWLINAAMDKPFIDLYQDDETFSGLSMFWGTLTITVVLLFVEAGLMTKLSKTRSTVATSVWILVTLATAVLVFMPFFGTVIYWVGCAIVGIWCAFWEAVFNVIIYLCAIVLLPGVVIAGFIKSIFKGR